MMRRKRLEYRPCPRCRAYPLLTVTDAGFAFFCEYCGKETAADSKPTIFGALRAWNRSVKKRSRGR